MDSINILCGVSILHNRNLSGRNLKRREEESFLSYTLETEMKLHIPVTAEVGCHEGIIERIKCQPVIFDSVRYVPNIPSLTNFAD